MTIEEEFKAIITCIRQCVVNDMEFNNLKNLIEDFKHKTFDAGVQFEKERLKRRIIKELNL